MFYILAGGWFLGTQIADTYNGMPAYNRIKGTARVVFFILDFMALAILINNKGRRIFVFAMGLATLMFLSSFDYVEDFAASVEIRVEPRLRDDGAAASPAYYYRRQRYAICFSIAFVMAVINFRNGFRSQLVILAISTVLILPIFDNAPAKAGQCSWQCKAHSEL